MRAVNTRTNQATDSVTFCLHYIVKRVLFDRVGDANFLCTYA